MMAAPAFAEEIPESEPPREDQDRQGWLDQITGGFSGTLVETLLGTPEPREIPMLARYWELTRQITTAFLLLAILSYGLRYITARNMGSSLVPIKLALPRLIMALVFSNFSLVICSEIIKINNALVVEYFSGALAGNIKSLIVETVGVLKSISILLAAVPYAVIIMAFPIAVMVILIVWLIVFYYLRLLEIWILTIVSPAAFIAWMNPSGAGLTSRWLTEFLAVVFTQPIHIILLGIFIKYRPFQILEIGELAGGINKLFSLMAWLILMVKVPGMVRGALRPVAGWLVPAMVEYRTGSHFGRKWEGKA